MKIRTDFVTNSSSSSFVLSIKIHLTNGRNLSYDSGEYSCEINGEIEMDVSPKQLGQSSSVKELTEMLREGVYHPISDYDEAEKRWIEKKKPAVQSFAREVASISSMDDVESITVTGKELYRTGDRWNRQFTYNRTTGEYTATISGGLEESEGTGGAIYFTDAEDAALSPNSCLYTEAVMTVECDDGYRGRFVWEGKPGTILNIRYSPKQLGTCSSLDELKSMLAEEFTDSKGKIIENPMGEEILSIESVIKIELKTAVNLWGEQITSPITAGNYSHKENFLYDRASGMYTHSVTGCKLAPVKGSGKKTGIVILFDDAAEASPPKSESADNWGLPAGKSISATEEMYPAKLQTNSVHTETVNVLHVGQEVYFTEEEVEKNNTIYQSIIPRVRIDDELKQIGTIDSNLQYVLLKKGAEYLKGRIALLKTTSIDGRKITPPGITVEIIAPIKGDDRKVKEPKHLEQEDRLTGIFNWRLKSILFTCPARKVNAMRDTLDAVDKNVIINYTGYFIGGYPMFMLQPGSSEFTELLHSSALTDPETEMFTNCGTGDSGEEKYYYSSLGSQQVETGGYIRMLGGQIDKRTMDERFARLIDDVTEYRIVITLKNGKELVFNPQRRPSSNFIDFEDPDLTKIATECFGYGDGKKEVFVHNLAGQIGSVEEISKIECSWRVKTKRVPKAVQKVVDDITLFHFIDSYVQSEKLTIYDFENDSIIKKNILSAFTVDTKEPGKINETVVEETEETETRGKKAESVREEAEKRIQAEQEAQRIEEEKKRQEERAAQEKAEAERLERLRKEEEARLAKERAEAEARRIEEEKKQQEERIAKEKAEAERLERLRKEEEARLAKEKAEAEAMRIAEEERLRREKEEEEAKKQNVYNEASALLITKGVTEKDLAKAANLFNSLGSYKDSNELKKKASDMLKAEKERIAEEARREKLKLIEERRTQYKEWKDTETAVIAKRKELLDKAVALYALTTREKEEKKYTELIMQNERVLSAMKKEKEDLTNSLSHLGFFAFSQKKETKNRLEKLELDILSFEEKLKQLIEEQNAIPGKINKLLPSFEQSETKRINDEIPLPDKPSFMEEENLWDEINNIIGTRKNDMISVSTITEKMNDLGYPLTIDELSAILENMGKTNSFYLWKDTKTNESFVVFEVDNETLS